MENKVFSTIHNVTEYGAVADGKSLCTKAFEMAFESCSKNGGGTVYVPAGNFLTGPIIMKSNTNLNLDAGAILTFINDEKEYSVVNSRWEGVLKKVYASCIYAENEENISITGRGTLEGKGKYWWDIFTENKIEFPRPKLISFHNCKNVLIEGLNLKNSPSWTINPICCQNVTIDKVSIFNPSDSPNTDGINPESCNNVHISNCHIDVGDDCIAIKSGTEDTKEKISCENITITNCTMIHGHGAVVLGSEMSGDIRNVTISNCVFENTDRGIRMKSRRGRGGKIEDIRINNLVMDGVLCPFVANLYYFCGPRGTDKYVWDKAAYPVTNETPAFKRIHFSNITARNVRVAAGFFYGLPEMCVEDISFENVSVAMAEDAEPGMPDMMANLEPMKGKGFLCCNVKDFYFNNVTISNHTGAAFHIEDYENIEFNNCRARGAKTEGKMIEFVNKPKNNGKIKWSDRMADSVMKRSPKLNQYWAYEYGLILKGIEKVWKDSGEKKYFDYIKRNMDEFINEDGSINKYDINEFNIDNINNGKLLFPLFKATGDLRYKKAAFLLRKQLKDQPRTNEGSFWHKKIYPYQVWLDGIYMAMPFYAEFIKEFGNTTEFDDITKQIVSCAKNTRDEKTGLLFHAWDEKREQFWCDKETGKSKNLWGRSMGWYIMALVDVLDYIPEDHSDRNKFIKILNEVASALLEVRDVQTGLWYQVLNLPEKKGNYLEASASYMIIYSLAKGIRKGYLSEVLTNTVKDSYSAAIEEFVTVTAEGSININKVCAMAGLGGKDKRDGTFEYYISEPIVSNDGKGVGAFILASREIELLN